MKAKMKTALMVLGMLSGCLLTACSVDDADSYDAHNGYISADYPFGAVYDGEWTVDKVVMDTARLEVTNVLKLRLPEQYLGISCFERESASSLVHTFEYYGQPSVIRFKDQGYTDYASFNSLSSTEKNYDGTLLFTQASFVVAVDGVDHRVDVLSNEPGNAVYRNDNGQWTIGFTVTAYNVTNLETHEEQVRAPHKPIPLYYSTKNRIR
ncbi:MAG: hypothetical protein J5797_12220 [Prevotella sp.]|nr:hypothetical protein [Prevotella sp.]